MRLELDETHLGIHLTRGEKILAVHGDITIPLAEITSVSVDPDPMQSIRGHLLVGLRVPRRRYLCTSGPGREFWAIRGSRPALRVSSPAAAFGWRPSRSRIPRGSPSASTCSDVP